MYKAVVFDLTGTILPRNKYQDTLIQSHLILNVSRIFGVPANHFAEEFWKEYEKTRSASKTLHKLLGIPRADAEYLVRISLHEIYHLVKIKKDRALTRMFKKLSQKYKLAIFSKIWLKTGEMILEQLGILPYFDFMLFGDLMPTRLEHALLLIKNYFKGTKPKDILVVGDNPEKDYYTPKRVGMDAVLIKSPHTSSDLLEDEDVEIIPDLLSLQRWLEDKEKKEKETVKKGKKSSGGS